MKRKMNTTKALLASIKVEKNGNGFLAKIPGIQGAFAEGDTIEEALFNCIDVMQMIQLWYQENKFILTEVTQKHL